MSIKSNPNSLVDSKYIGIPYKLGAKSFKEADCIGVCLLWLEEQGFKYNYDDKQGPVLKHWWEHNPWRFRDALLRHGFMVSFSELKKCDCLMFFFDDPLNRYPTCMGIMIDDRHFLISLEKSGSQVIKLNKEWKNKFFGALRLHKVVEREVH